jgi:hypothetical protein
VMWVMWNLTSLHLDTVLVSVQNLCTVCTERTIGSEIDLDTPNGTPRSRRSSESLVYLEIVLILMQERCTICVKRTIGSEIILDAPMELLCDMGLVESHFFLFGDSVTVGAR